MQKPHFREKGVKCIRKTIHDFIHRFSSRSIDQSISPLSQIHWCLHPVAAMSLSPAEMARRSGNKTRGRSTPFPAWSVTTPRSEARKLFAVAAAYDIDDDHVVYYAADCDNNDNDDGNDDDECN